MTDNLVNLLEAMHANGEVLGHLSIRFPGDKLKAGWIETGLLTKGITGNLVDKENQNRYVIPLSTSMRSVIDRGVSSSGAAGIMLLGTPGLRSEKFVVVFRNESQDGKLFRNISAFWIKEFTPHEITRIFLRHELGVDVSSSFDEPGVDYVEYIREQTTIGTCAEAFSLNVPSDWSNLRTWIPDSVKDDSSDSIIFKHETSKNSTALALLLSNWIKDMSETLKIDKPVGACFFIRGETSELFFWDGPRNILTTSIFNESDIDKHAMNILLPLWAVSTEPIPSTKVAIDTPIGDSKAPSSEPTTEGPPRIPPEYEEIARRARGLVSKIDIEDTYRRIERIESILGELEHTRNQKDEQPAASHPNLMESRIKEAIESLEEITKRLSELEERIVTVCREIE